ncbi:hypothetical protein ACMHYB_45505 [Sorangium sp. So ce1128]
MIDALEKPPSANIDPRRIAVTGCSRDGKGALTAGAFDELSLVTGARRSLVAVTGASGPSSPPTRPCRARTSASRRRCSRWHHGARTS